MGWSLVDQDWSLDSFLLIAPWIGRHPSHRHHLDSNDAQCYPCKRLQWTTALVPLHQYLRPDLVSDLHGKTFERSLKVRQGQEAEDGPMGRAQKSPQKESHCYQPY